MTELERHLLNALEQLQQDYMQRLNEWENAFVELQKMFSLTQRDNAMLNEWENAFVELQKMFSLTQRDNAMLNGRVMQLSQQVQHLSERTERLSQLYSENRR
ncbi:TPA: MbeD family mobilization/exclusion protein [Escherichia coli]|nr:MbeD family mobilization/exclusion protein [Escherichia coli]